MRLGLHLYVLTSARSGSICNNVLPETSGESTYACKFDREGGHFDKYLLPEWP